MEIFSNREIATVIWLLGLSIFALSKQNIRASLKGVLNSFVKWKVALSLLLMITFTTAIVLFLNNLGFWNLFLLKDTFLWFFLVGVPLYVGWITSKKDHNIFKEIATENLKLILLIEFIVNVHSFSLFIEIFLVPFVTIVVMMNTYIEATEPNSTASRFLGWIQTIIGFTIVGFAIVDSVTNYDGMLTLNSLSEFLNPILLSILSSPFVYFMALLASYESLFIGLEMGRQKNPGLKRYAKKEIIKYCKLSRIKVQRALNMGIYNLTRIQNKADVDDLILKYKKAAI